MRTKKIFIAATALGLVLGFFDVAWGASNHSKLKKPHKSFNTQHAKQRVELVHFLERVQAGKATASDKTLEADFATLEVYRATGVGGIPPGLSKFFQAHANAVNDAMGGHTIAQLISSLKTGPAVITRYEWDKLATQIKSNTSALSTLTNTTVAALQTNVDTLQGQMTGVVSSVGTLEGQMTGVVSSVATLQTDVLSNWNTIEGQLVSNWNTYEGQFAQIDQQLVSNWNTIEGQLASNWNTYEGQFAQIDQQLTQKANVTDVTMLQAQLAGTAASGLETQVQQNKNNIASNLQSIQNNLTSINANAAKISAAETDIKANASNIHQLGLAVQTNSNQIVRVANNELRNMKAVRSLGETVKQNVAGTEINTQLAKALDQQSSIDESELQKMNTEIFENAQALGNTTAVSEDGNDFMASAKNLANLSQLLAVAHHHNAQAHKAANTNLQETTARLQALHLALTKAQEVSKRDAKLTRALKEPIATAHNALKTSQRLQAMIDKQKVRLHMQGKSDSEVIAKVRAEADRTAKKITQLKALQHQITKANQYKKAADENAKRAHKQAIEAYVDSNFEQQPHSARDTLRMKENQNIMLKED